MSKLKKITIRYYLNKRLKSTETEQGTKYPLYVRVTFNRQTIQFALPLYFDLFLSGGLTDDEFEQIFIRRTNDKIKGWTDEFEKILSDAIRFEFTHLGEKFTLTGIADRFEFYNLPFYQELETFVKLKFKKFMAEKVTTAELNFLFNWSMFLVDTYKLSKSILGESVKEQLPAELVYLITAYIQFTAFNSQREFDIDRHDEIHSWFSTGLNIDFKNFLFAPLSENELFKNEAKGSPVLSLWREFPIITKNVPMYLAAIDQFILVGHNVNLGVR